MLSCSRFDRRLSDSFSKEIFNGACLEDATRYVDDLRIVLRLDSKRDLADVERKTLTWLDSLLSDEPGVTVSTDKTHAAYFGVHADRPTVRQSDRMTRDPKRGVRWVRCCWRGSNP